MRLRKHPQRRRGVPSTHKVDREDGRRNITAERATEETPGSKLPAPAFSSFAVQGADDKWRRQDVLLESVATFLRKYRDMKASMYPLALLGLFGWLVEPFVDGLSPPPRLSKDRTPVAGQPDVFDCGDGVFDRGLLGLTVDERMAAMQKFDEMLFSNTPYAWLAQQCVVVTMDGASRGAQSLLVGAPAHVRLPCR